MSTPFRLVFFLNCLFLITTSLASDVVKIENKIIMNMIQSLTHNTNISIYTDSKRLQKILTDNIVNFVPVCSDADVAILETKHVKNCNKLPIITLKYELLKTYQNSVGSFFWQKGRPNIVFIAPRLKSQNISVGSKFDAFVEESIW